MRHQLPQIICIHMCQIYDTWCVFKNVCSFCTSKCLHHTARYDMWCCVAISELPCVRLLSHATVLRAKIHFHIALWVEKSIMLLLPPPPHPYSSYSGLSSDFIDTQPLTCYVLVLQIFRLVHPRYSLVLLFHSLLRINLPLPLILSLHIYLLVFILLHLFDSFSFLASFLLLIHDNAVLIA